jgi:hypothetical protein
MPQVLTIGNPLTQELDLLVGSRLCIGRLASWLWLILGGKQLVVISKVGRSYDRRQQFHLLSDGTTEVGIVQEVGWL